MSVKDKIKKMKCLADAIEAVTRHPFTVRMGSIWSCVENKDDLKQFSPEELEEYEAEVKKLDQAKTRRSELNTAFNEARLYLRESEAVFLAHRIKYMPSICEDAWTHIDDDYDNDKNKMNDIAIRLRFRADKESSKRPAEPVAEGQGMLALGPAHSVELENINVAGSGMRKSGGLTPAQQEAARNRRKFPEHRKKIVEFYKGLRPERSKMEAAQLALKWMRRSEQNGGLGITKAELPDPKTIQRWADDA